MSAGAPVRRSEANVVTLAVRSAGEVPAHGVADVIGCEGGAESVANGEDVDGLVGGRLGVGRSRAGDDRRDHDEETEGEGSMSHMPMRRFAHDARNASSRRARALAQLCAAAAAAFLVACGSDSSPTGPGGSTQDAERLYAISTINASALPVAIFSDTGGFKLEVMSGTIALSADGKYSIVTNYRETMPGVSDTYTDSTGGTWAMTPARRRSCSRASADGTPDQATWTTAAHVRRTGYLAAADHLRLQAQAVGTCASSRRRRTTRSRDRSSIRRCARAGT